jgi:hypothetical protein
MKKLAIFVLISVLLTFTAAMALAHDDDNNWDRFYGNRFHGTYEMVASGICNHSTGGWVDAKGVTNGPNPIPPFTPVAGSKTWAANATMQATFLFKRDGSGTFAGTNYISLLPGGEPVNKIRHYQVSQSPIAGTFKYEITNNGVITITTGGGTVMNGMITADKNTMNLVSANQILDYTKSDYESYAINNMVRVLIRVSD